MGEHTQDQRLVHRCLNGEADAFERLLNLHKGRVFSFILRLVQNNADAEDLAQETFVKAFRSLASYDAGYPLMTWIFKIAHNTTIDFLRAKKSGQVVSLDDEAEPIELSDKGPSLEASLERASDKELVDKLLAALPPLYREALLLRHQEGLDYAAIGRILQLPEGTVKIRLFRARDMMRKKLDGVGYAG